MGQRPTFSTSTNHPFQEMKELNKASFQRSLSPHQSSEHRPTLHIFADTSQEALSACAYIMDDY